MRRNPLAPLVETSIRASRIDRAPAAQVAGPRGLGTDAGTIDPDTGKWVPYGRLGIDPLGSFRLSSRRK